MAHITSANAVITISVSGVFSTPFQLQGFSADNIYDAPETELVQTSMGVDGRLSGGIVFNPFEQTFMIQADSVDTIRFFETWAGRMRTNKTPYTANGNTRLSSVNRNYVMRKGFLVNAHQIAPGARTLQPRRFTIRWESVTPASIA